MYTVSVSGYNKVDTILKVVPSNPTENAYQFGVTMGSYKA